MRQSDAAAALAILCGTLLGAQFFERLNAPPADRAVARVHVVQLPVETPQVEVTPVTARETRVVTLRVTSADPDREARFRMVLRDYPEGETTDVVTPFTLTATENGIAGTLDAFEGDPDIRASIEIDGPGAPKLSGISVSGDELWIDSEAVTGGTLPGSGR